MNASNLGQGQAGPPTSDTSSFWGENSEKAEVIDATQNICCTNTPAHSQKEKSIVQIMLTRIAETDAHFKHQQRDEPDLTFDEKLQIATEIFNRSPTTFLSRFGKYLVAEDLKVFDALSEDYEVGFYIRDVKQRLNDKTNEMKIRNRRFEAMKKMIAEGEYFDEESMKSRDPLLYEQMVGQYLTEEQVKAQVADQDLGFSSVLMQHVQSLQNAEMYEQQQETEDGQMEEEDDEEEMEETGSDGKPAIGVVEQQMLRNEFLRTMQLRFLNGQDSTHFDYRDVDENVEYDSLDIRTQDEQESYFDHDEEDHLIEEARDVYSKVQSMVSNSCNSSCNQRDLASYKSDIDCLSKNAQLESNKYSSPLNQNEETVPTSSCVDNQECKSNELKTAARSETTDKNKIDTITAIESSQEVDYEDFVLTEDVCPGLRTDKSDPH